LDDSRDLVGAVAELLAPTRPARPTTPAGATPAVDCTSCTSSLVRNVIEGAHDGCILVTRDDRVAAVTARALELLEDWTPIVEDAPLPDALRVTHPYVLTTTKQRSIHLEPAEGLDCSCRAIWVRDATDEVRSGDLERRLLHSDRLAAMGQLAAGVAHEVNNPAAFVTANLCMMSEYVDQLRRAMTDVESRAEHDDMLARHAGAIEEAHSVSETLRDLGQIILENIEGMGRISAILRDLRNFSRIEEGQVELVHPNEIVNSACSLAHNQIRHRAQLIKELGDVPSLPADRNKLVQVLMNLLMNAAQATPDGDNRAHFIRVATLERDGQVHITVTDNGCGISPEHRERIFEPFFTTKGRDRGTGLGLALCAEISRQHGGDIDVRSEVGKGSRFDVRLPIESSLRAGSARTTPRADEAPSSSEPAASEDAASILLIDDEIMVLRAFTRALKKRHAIRTAASGEEALELLRAGAAFDVIVCDLMMPGIDGIRLFEEVEAFAPEILPRFIFCSGGAFTPRARAFCARLEVPVLEKPLTTANLEQAIQEALRRARDAGPRTSDLGSRPADVAAP